MSHSLDESRPIDSRGRASPPGEASSGELSGELKYRYCEKWKRDKFIVNTMLEPNRLYGKQKIKNVM